MERLTKWNDKTEGAELISWNEEEWKDFMGSLDVPICTELSIAIDKLAEYEDIEEKITNKFAGCIDIKTILDSFCAFYDMQEINEELAQCTLLTNEDVLKYRRWKEAEEQGLLLRLPCRLGDIIDRIISHNEIVTLMFETEVCSFRGLQHFWHGMAWNIPKEYLELPFVKIHGVVPNKITEADTIWIEVRKEAGQALARMEEEDV